MTIEYKQSNRNAPRIWTNKQNNIHTSVFGFLLQAYKPSIILLWSVRFKWLAVPTPIPAPTCPLRCHTCRGSNVTPVEHPVSVGCGLGAARRLPAVCRIRTQRGYRGRSSVRGSPCMQSPRPRALPLQPQTVVWNDSTRVTSVSVILQQWTLITDS